jgi:uncharacterized secreted repeat protein (TIGR03808 family)
MDRRSFILGSAGLSLALPAMAGVDSPSVFSASLRGSINAAELGVVPGALDDQSRKFQRMLDASSDRDQPVFLPAGTYVVSNLNLPRSVRLSGVPGATRLIYGGDGHMLLAEQTELLMLEGITFDGANRWLGEDVLGLIQARGVAQLDISGCRIIGAGRNGIALERCSGRVTRNEVSGAADAGLYSVQAGAMEISGNTVGACGNGGILVHRWEAGKDGTLVSGNRVSDIAAQAGGTGQYGNGINIFRADGVIVSGNTVSNCAFSAIRANSASNLQITANSCHGSGETAIYAEFAFAGAVINSNIVDGGANGISIVNFNEGGRMATCSGNIVRNLSTKGPYPADPPGFGTGITVEADTSVTGNVIENAPRAGISIGWGEFMRNVVANANVIRDAGVGIAVSVVEGTGSAVITDNVIERARTGAIVGYRWTEPATEDLALSPTTTDRLTVERNRTS